MPPKRAAAAATKAIKTRATKAEPRVNGESSRPRAAKAAAKKPTTKAVEKVKPAPANTASKRKSEDDTEEPRVNGVKRQRTRSESATPAPEPKQKKTATKKIALSARTQKQKAVVNSAATQRLNVYVFGDGSNGELGLGNAKGQTEVKRPRLNPLLDADKVGVVHLVVGGMHTAALTHDNKILTWGVNDQGALGRDTTWEGGLRDVDDEGSDDDSESGSETGVNPHEATPGEVDMSGLPEGIVWTKLAATDSATFALTDDGFVYGWGTFRSNEGIFGFSLTSLIQRTPARVEKLSKITALAAGANHVLALQSNGAVFAWGSGQQNQLGRRILERTKLNSLVPTQFGLPKKMTGVGAGAYHSFAMHQNGDVYSWGLNSYGETGIAKMIGEGGEADVHHPTIIETLRNRGTVVCIEGGAHHTVAVTDRGELLVWGRVDGYQLGLDIKALPGDEVIMDSANHPRILTTPTQVPNINATYAAAGSDHCVAAAQDGKAYAWGFSATYQTGLGTDDDVELATHIDNTATRGKKLVWAGCGGQFSVLAGLAEMSNGA